MVKSNNKGFSLVEIIIAAAIFAILIYPITNALITATKTGTTSTKKQYAVEKAEEIMEIFKTADLSGNVNIPDGNGTKTYSFTKGTPSGKSITLPNSKTAEYSDTTYTCNDVSIGKSYETYTCQVDVNDAAYQVLKNGYVLAGLDGGATFKSDESGATGNNLDNLAYQYFLDAKLDVLRKYDVQYNHYLSGGGTFNEDHFQKNTKIKISKLGSTYTVECYVEYTDYTTVSVIRSQYESSGKNVYKPTTLYGDGIVYKQEFTNGLPPVYLLYVPAIYNGSYCTTDTITVDNSGISEKADVYVFETTAELSDTYKKIIREQFNVANVDDLTYTNTGKNTKMSDVKVRLKLAAGAKSSDLNVYANFDFDNVNSDYPVARLTEDQSDSVYMYDITVTLTDSKGNKTTVTGTRGK